MLSDERAEFNMLDAAEEIAKLREETTGNVPMTDTPSDAPPDRLSVNPKSPHFNQEVLQRDVGIRFNGEERTNVEEYCVSEGWIKVAVGKTMDRKGNPLTLTVKGKVEPYYRAPAAMTGETDPNG